MTRPILFLLLLGWIGIPRGAGEPPVIRSITPLALRPGMTNVVTVRGDRLNGPIALWSGFPAMIEREVAEEPNHFVWRVTPASTLKPGWGVIRLLTTNGLSSFYPVLLDDVELDAKSDHLRRARGKSAATRAVKDLSIPGAIDGIVEAEKSERFELDLKRGQRVIIDAVAHRFSSSLDPVLRLTDARGREMGFCDDDPLLGRDSRLRFKAPAKGRYGLELRDINYQGGSNYFYHLRVAKGPAPGWRLAPMHGLSRAALEGTAPPGLREREPNDRADQAQPIGIPVRIVGRFETKNDRDLYSFEVRKDEKVSFRSRTRRLGSPCDAFMRLLSSTEVLLAETKVSDTNDAALNHTFKEAGQVLLEVTELTGQAGPGRNYEVLVARFQPTFELRVDTETAQGAPGREFELKVSAVRQEYEGSIRLDVVGLPAGVELAGAEVPEKKNETTLKIKLPEDCAAGQMFHFRVVGMGTGAVAETRVEASTGAALRKVFPNMLYPDPELDGWIGLGVIEKPNP